ncbi:MAG: hypothetical protein RL377_1623 [Bacteroidota bacterium]|jgi:hypothetical protein
MNDWKKVFSTSDLASAALVTGILNENEIPAKVLDKKDSAFVFMGKAEVYVPSINEHTALELIKSINLDSIEA